ncbi:MAG: hypothetical protein ACOCRK_02180 [bacterium]
MRKFTIQSDTKGKLDKIIKGVVYSDPLVFVTEFMQNSYRANVKNLFINYDKENSTLTFKDDGKGLKDIKNILTLDYSSWDWTDEGFGIGFWSWLGFDNKENDDEINDVTCIVRSKRKQIVLSKLQLLKDLEPIAIIKESEYFIDGFSVTLKSSILNSSQVATALVERIYSDGELMPYNVYYNGEHIKPKDILTNVTGDFTKEFSTRYFTAKLSVDDRYGDTMLYYEKRKVRELYESNVSGAIELKKNALNLREPDRKDFSYDAKYSKFINRFDKCKKDLYKDFVKEANDMLLDKYATPISNILDVNDYARFLEIDNIILEPSEEADTTLNIDNSSLSALNNFVANNSNESQISLFENKTSIKEPETIAKTLNKVNPELNTEWVKTDEYEDDASKWQTEEITDNTIKESNKIIIKGNVFKKVSCNKEDFIKDDIDVTNNIKNPH